jgi:hypothetical protein
MLHTTMNTVTNPHSDYHTAEHMVVARRVWCGVVSAEIPTRLSSALPKDDSSPAITDAHTICISVCKY